VSAQELAPRILCIGIPVRDLIFRVQGVPDRGSKANASHLEEIYGGNALKCRDRHRTSRRPRLARRALRFASAAAALKCTRFGGALAAPQRIEIEELLHRSEEGRPAGAL
jgi:sugar/nucleoside kinase (ribokinase family)